MKLSIPLVGMHFRPPAQEILNGLALGTQVFLMPEPTNQYDRNAVKVLIDLAELSAERLDLIDALLPPGVYTADLINQGPFMLGYLAATGGKPARGGPGNVEALKLIGNAEVFFGKLAAAPEGYAVVTLEQNPHE